MKDSELDELIRQAYGFSDAQLSEELDRAMQFVTDEDKKAGDYEVIRKRIENLEQEQNTKRKANK